MKSIKKTKWLKDAIWSKEYVAQGRPIRTSFLQVTVAVAMAFLNEMPINRKVNQNNVNNIARDIVRGHYLFNPQACALFSKKGMMNAQHTCLAVIQCGMSIPMLVHEGLDENLFDVVDCGKPRTLADSLYIHRVGNAKESAIAVNIVYKYLHNKHRINNGPVESKPVLVAHYKKNEEIYREGCDFAVERKSELKMLKGKNRQSPTLSMGIWIALYTIFSMKSREDAKRFFKLLIDDRDDGPCALGKIDANGAVTQLRTQLIHGQHPKTMRQEQKTAYVINIWNAFRSGSSSKSISWESDEKCRNVEAI